MTELTIKTQQQLFDDVWSKGEPQHYTKKGEVEARKAVAGEKIVTILDGEIETSNTAKANDVIIKGPKGEEYIVDSEKFGKRYEGGSLSDSFSKFKAKGETFGIEYSGQPIEFMAAWGEKMILKTGDFLCNPDKDKPGDLYRIEKEAFGMTYQADEPSFKSRLKTLKDSLSLEESQNTAKAGFKMK